MQPEPLRALDRASSVRSIESDMQVARRAHLTSEYIVIVNLVSLTPIYLNKTLD